MPKDDLVYLGHMLDYARSAVEMVHGVSHEEYEKNATLRFALTHLVQIIGEAARRVSDVTRSQYPQIQWPLIVGMRLKVVHDYFDVDFEIVWQVVTADLPPLIEILQTVVKDD